MYEPPCNMTTYKLLFKNDYNINDSSFLLPQLDRNLSEVVVTEEKYRQHHPLPPYYYYGVHLNHWEYFADEFECQINNKLAVPELTGKRTLKWKIKDKKLYKDVYDNKHGNI